MDLRRPDARGDLLASVVTGVEWLVAALLVVLAVLGTITLGVSMARLVSAGLAMTAGAFVSILDATLLVFVVAELFKIALAYIRHEAVIPTVMEAALVAVARKLVVLDTHVPPLELLAHAGAYALLLLAVGVVWYLLARTKSAWLAADVVSQRTGDASPEVAGERVTRPG